ncbi:hypothetical protein H4V97_002875 [Flavobacterium sp. CG_23.5]|uniref:hypothetical protein n=1 Tax=Flavobacterium sp. CG_23.5 TaxID=2760708 RepID=UPI001AEB7B58|nr:hypothetical protein [Flavobacterium sp. CG_23.5]MBP2284557.1 hypothetical protein [Flavobacterium sp. CG_23.5]
MKKVLVLSLVLMSILVSCKKEKEVEVVPVAPEKIAVEESISEECYSGTIKKDTISMNLIVKGNQVTSGKLSYNFYEKDKNEGTLVGEIKGDTLLADYTFMSEGVSSVRQVVFLKKGNTYVEGFGDVVDDNKGKVAFKDRKQLKFDGKTVLSKVECKM